MLCENCKKNVATTYFKQTVNGKTSEIFLCSDCAAKLGLDTSVPMFGFDSFLPTFLSGSHELEEVRCPNCGMPFREILQTGKVGCDRCYDVFAKQLKPALHRMHGGKKHAGKIPFSFSGTKKSELETLRADLARAVENEDFEQAAVLRDRIKEQEAKQKEA